MVKKSSDTYEFENVSHEDYCKNQKVAIDVLIQVSKYYEIPISKIRYFNVINFFFNRFDIKLLAFENGNQTLLGCSPDPDLDLLVFNSMLQLNSIDVKAKEMKYVNHQFSDNVDGLTLNQTHKHIMMINGSIDYSPRLIFTILHELSHIYLSEKSNDYLSLVAKINESDDSSPEELRPIETGANIIASELFVNKLALENAISLNQTFTEMCSQFGISKGALHNRLLNYLEHSQRFRYSLAKDCTFQIRNDDQQGINRVKKVISFVNGGCIHNSRVIADAFDEINLSI